MNWCRIFSHREIWKALWRSFLEPALGITWLHLRVFREKWTACVTTMCFFSPAPVPMKRVTKNSLQDPFTLASGSCDECTTCNPLKHPQPKKQAWKLKQTILFSHLLTPQPGFWNRSNPLPKEASNHASISEVSDRLQKATHVVHVHVDTHRSQVLPKRTAPHPTGGMSGRWMEDPPNLREVSPWFSP